MIESGKASVQPSLRASPPRSAAQVADWPGAVTYELPARYSAPSSESANPPPLQRPSAARRGAAIHGPSGHPALPLLAQLPVTWDDTRCLAGVPGEYAVLARRAGADWYVGAMNGRKA